MKLVLLGTGGYFPTARRHTACILLPEVGVALDAGSGMCRIAEYLATDRLDIFLTHAHLDHVLGLTYLVNLVPPDVLERTTVHGTAAKLNAVRDHVFAELIFPVAPRFKFQSLRQNTSLPNGGTLTYFPLTHPGGTLGYRLEWPGHKLAYVTDTTARTDADYISRIRGADLLMHEAYFPDETNDLPALTGHSSLSAVAELAAAANVGRLLLVHLNPRIDSDAALDLTAARSKFKNIQVGEDLMQLEF